MCSGGAVFLAMPEEGSGCFGVKLEATDGVRPSDALGFAQRPGWP